MIKNSKRKISGYMVFDAYDIFDCYGTFTKIFRVYKGKKFLGIAKF